MCPTRGHPRGPGGSRGEVHHRHNHRAADPAPTESARTFMSILGIHPLLHSKLESKSLMRLSMLLIASFWINRTLLSLTHRIHLTKCTGQMHTPYQDMHPPDFAAYLMFGTSLNYIANIFRAATLGCSPKNILHEVMSS